MLKWQQWQLVGFLARWLLRAGLFVHSPKWMVVDFRVGPIWVGLAPSKVCAPRQWVCTHVVGRREGNWKTYSLAILGCHEWMCNKMLQFKHLLISYERSQPGPNPRTHDPLLSPPSTPAEIFRCTCLEGGHNRSRLPPLLFWAPLRGEKNIF